jgi:hypothetical protein
VPQPGDPQSLNRFSYGLNNPVKYRDSSGHIPCYGDERGECSWAGTDRQPQGDSGRRRDISNYAHFVANSARAGATTDLEALASLTDFAAMFGTNAQTFADDVSYAIVGVGGAGTVVNAALTTPPGFQRPPFRDTGFNRNYQDSDNQPYHFWSYVNTTAQTPVRGAGLSLIANVFHEGYDPAEAFREPHGTTLEDYVLTFKGMELGEGLGLGSVTPGQTGDWIRGNLSHPYGLTYDVANAIRADDWLWPSAWMEMVVDHTPLSTLKRPRD